MLVLNNENMKKICYEIKLLTASDLITKKNKSHHK